jgi:hypothetical protein
MSDSIDISCSPATAPAHVAGAAAREDPQVWWAYCVLASDRAGAIADELEGVEPGTSVTILGEGRLAALISPVPLSQYDDERLREHLEDIEWLARTARAHESVLDQALRHATIVPLRLCTIYRDHDGVRRLLREREQLLSESLAAIEGCVECGVKVFTSGAQPAQATAESELAAAGASEGEAGARPGTEYLLRRRQERDQGELARQRCARCADAVHERVAAVSQAANINAPQRPETHGREGQMLLNGVYLVARGRIGEVEETVEALRGEWGPGGFEIELTGPWPAYNFISGEAGIVS